MTHLQQIRNWIRDAGQTIDRDNPRQASLYAGLCLEEGGIELMQAMGMHFEAGQMQAASMSLRQGGAERGIEQADRAELLDAAIDLAASLGADVEGALGEVIRSNDSKRNPDGSMSLDATGKVIKPETYSPPDLRPFLPKEAA